NAMVRTYPDGSWMTADIGTVCQAVQRSAFPDAYAREAHDAQLIVTTLLGTAGAGRSGPATLVDRAGMLHTFARGTDGSLKHWYWSNGWNSDVPGTGISGSPSVISDGSDMVHVFAQG